MSKNGWTEYTVWGRPVGREVEIKVKARNDNEAYAIGEKRLAEVLDSYDVEIIEVVKKE